MEEKEEDQQKVKIGGNSEINYESCESYDDNDG